MHLLVEKHKIIGKICHSIIISDAIVTAILAKLAQLQTSFSFWRII